jgi:hypothetical protein
MKLDWRTTRLIHEWLHLSHEIVAEIHISRDEEIIYLGEVLSQPPESDVCSPKHVETRRLMLHTHPKRCYEREHITFGWPSGQDFYSILENSLPLHIVAAVEGWYLIHLKKYGERYWHTLSTAQKKTWKKRMDLPGDEGSVDEYLQAINQFPWFQVTFEEYEN